MTTATAEKIIDTKVVEEDGETIYDATQAPRRGAARAKRGLGGVTKPLRRLSNSAASAAVVVFHTSGRATKRALAGTKRFLTSDGFIIGVIIAAAVASIAIAIGLSAVFLMWLFALIVAAIPTTGGLILAWLVCIGLIVTGLTPGQLMARVALRMFGTPGEWVINR